MSLCLSYSSNALLFLLLSSSIFSYLILSSSSLRALSNSASLSF